jgi:hypothetical protein
MKTVRPLLFFVSFLMIVGLACSGGATPPTQVPPTAVQVIATNPPPPTEVPPTEPPATEVATEVATQVATEPPAPQFFNEEFDNPLSGNWDVLTVTGSDKADPDKVTVDSQNGKLVWNFDSEYVYYYIFYNAFDYEDVRLDVNADNRGRNNNSISLICRHDPNVGWYEFNIANNGLYDILYAEVTESGKISYSTIANGGSNAIKQGKEVNEYGIECKGTALTLYINGDKVTSVTEKKYGLRSGQVGVSVSSFNVLPILIEMDWIKISEP